MKSKLLFYKPLQETGSQCKKFTPVITHCVCCSTPK